MLINSALAIKDLKHRIRVLEKSIRQGDAIIPHLLIYPEAKKLVEENQEDFRKLRDTMANRLTELPGH